MTEKKQLSEKQIHEIIEIAWCDKTSIEKIYQQTSFTADEVKALMKKQLKPSSYTLWRKRVKQKKQKNEKKFLGSHDNA